MKHKFLKIAGVSSEKEFYKKYPSEQAFFKAHPEALKQMQTGGGLQDQQIFQYPNYDQNMAAYAQQAQMDAQNNPFNPFANMMMNGALAVGQAADNGSENAMNAVNKTASFFGMPTMQMGGAGMMMRDTQYDEGGEMALGQIMAMHDKLSNLQKFVNSNSEIEPWVASKITLADDYLNSVSEYMQYNEGAEGQEEEEDTDMNMGEMEEMKMGGIPQRYKSRGFTKVGAKRKSDRAGKKWMVLAKKGDKYKIVHGGYDGMKDFSQHGSEKRKDNFWNRMGGKDSAKAKDPFSPLYWHKRFGTWANGGEPTNAGFQALPDYVQNKIMGNMAYGGDMYGGQMDMDTMYSMMRNGGNNMYQDGGQDQVMQAIQMYAQMTQADPKEIIKQLQAMSPEEQQKAIQQIMQVVQQAQGSQQMAYGGIHINPANKGKFTASANRAGMGVQEFANQVLGNKEDYSSTQIKRANFAHVFGGRNYQDGGYVMGNEYEMSDDEIQDLINKGYKVEYV